MADPKPTPTPTPDSRRTSLVITLPDPDHMTPEYFAHVGATITFRSETHHYPNFRVCFDGENPFNTKQNAVFSGSDSKPVTLRVTRECHFRYRIEQTGPTGKLPPLPPPPVAFGRTEPCSFCQPPM